MLMFSNETFRNKNTGNGKAREEGGTGAKGGEEGVWEHTAGV